jgi:hypothetical protein
VRLHPEARKYFGLAVPEEDGIVHYYQFTVMVYGLKSAVQEVTRLLLPLKAYIHKLGILFSIFVDDGRVVANTADKVFWQQKVVLHIFNWRVGTSTGKRLSWYEPKCSIRVLSQIQMR